MTFSAFQPASAAPQVLPGWYDPVLVVLSIAIAAFASYVALGLAGRVAAARGRLRAAWLLAGALAMGTGIWSMHFVGMLAFRLPVPMGYAGGHLLVSVLVAVGASALALYVVGRERVRAPALSVATLLMGAAVAGMHYIGMAGVRAPARLEHDPGLVALSLLIAVGASFGALWLFLRFRHDRGGARTLGPRLASAAVMGVAIAGMHYTAMAAARFVRDPGPSRLAESWLVASDALAAAVVAATFVVLTIALAAVVMDRYLRAKAAEAEAHRRWGRIFEHGGWGIRIGSADGQRVEGANAAFARMHGFEPDEVIGMPAARFYPEEWLPVLEENHRRAAVSGTASFEAEHLRRDGSRFPVRVDITAIRETGRDEVTFVYNVQDITERRQVEAERRKIQERIAGIIDSAMDAIISVDVEQRIVVFNKAAEQAFGVPAAEALGRPLDDFIPERFRERHREEVRRFGLTGVTSRTMHSPARALGLRADGTEFPIEATISQIGEGAEKLYTVILRDVTERVRTEEALQASEERLRQAQKMEAVGRLAGGIAHDFNNQLTAILGFAHLLRREFPEGSRQYRDLAEIVKAAERSATLTQQLLAFSRKQVLQPRLLDLNAIVRDLQPMLERLLGEEYEVVLRLAPTLGSIRADAGQLEQVLVNLVVNARDAMPGGGRVLVETAAVDFRDERAAAHVGIEPGHYAVLSVNDTGVGMDPETRAHAFEPFFTTKPLGEGTGLGLSTVYGIVTQSGGTVTVYSELGLGTTIKVYLPIAVPAAGAPAAAAASGAERPLGGTETILVVDDQEPVRLLARSVLEGAGYRVLTAESGDAALATASRHGPLIHLLITDMVMPGMSGRVLADSFALTRPEMRVLFTSGYSEAIVTTPDGARSGPFLQKPFTPEELLRQVRAALDAPAVEAASSDPGNPPSA